MIKLLHLTYLYPKKYGLICAIFGIMIGLMVISVYQYSLHVSSLYHMSERINHYQHAMDGWINLLYPFLIIVLVIDHDHPSIAPLSAYHSRHWIMYMKWVYFIGIIFWLTLLTVIFTHMIPWLMNSNYVPSYGWTWTFLHRLGDGLLLFIMIILTTSDKHKIVALAWGLVYIVLTFLHEDTNQLYLYYIFPVKSEFYTHYMLAYAYKLCYISLGLFITQKFHDYKDIL